MKHIPIIYGIKNCNTMKKAFSHLDTLGISYVFHDYKKQGIDEEHLARWCKEHGWQKVINMSGLTFKKLSEEQKKDLDETKAIALMMAFPSMIKRPILEFESKTFLGFNSDSYDQFFSGSN